MAIFVIPCLALATRHQPAGSTEPVRIAAASLSLTRPATVAKGMEFTIDLNLVTPSNLLGVSFDLAFTTSLVDWKKTDTTGNPFGNGVLYFGKVDETKGLVSLAYARPGPARGVDVGGRLVRLKFFTTLLAAVNKYVVFEVKNLTAIDSSGASVSFPATLDSSKVVMGTVVWPGDTDSSGVVTQADLLPIALYWSLTGPSKRADTTTTWTAKPTATWTPSRAAYADANGDSVINQTDVLAIGLNWGKIATAGLFSIRPTPVKSQEVSAVAGGTPALRPVGPNSTTSNGEFNVDIVIGDQANQVFNLFGISYVLDFSTSKNVIQVLDVSQGTFLGSDIIFFPYIDSKAGTVSLGITRKSGQNGVTGNGTVAQIRFKTVNANSTVMFQTRDIAAISPVGSTIQVSPANSSTLVSVQETAEIPTQFSLLQNYPNPFNPNTTIRYQVPKSSYVSIQIYNELGQIVATLVDEKKEAGAYQVQWNASVPTGMYLCRLQARDASSGTVRGFVETKKMILLR